MTEDNNNGKHTPKGDWTDDIDYYCYRVVRELVPRGPDEEKLDSSGLPHRDYLYYIVEVYYDKDDNILDYIDAEPVFGDSLNGLRDDIAFNLLALSNPVLDYKDLPQTRGGE